VRRGSNAASRGAHADPPVDFGFPPSCHNHWVGNCWLDALNAGNTTFVINPVLVSLVGELLQRHGSRRASRVPSTGIVGVAIALASCDDAVDVFGFGNRSDTEVCDHYWECRTDQGAYLGRPTHSFGAQWEALLWLRSVGAIRLHTMAPGAGAFTLPAGRPRLNV